MAKVKVILWKHQMNQDGTYPLRLRIYKNRKTSYASTGYSLKEGHWNEQKGEVKPSHPNTKRLNHILTKLVSDTLDNIIAIETKTPAASIYRIKESLNKKVEYHRFFSYAFEFLERYNNPHQKNTYKGYVCKIEIFQKFVKGQDLQFDDITVTLIREFETYLRKQGKRTNTIGTNMKRIRLIYKAAVREGLADPSANPFNQYRIKTEASHKTKLTSKEINAIRELELEPDTLTWHTRNAFLLSFNLMGMRAGDITLLNWCNIRENRVEYRMRKTKVSKSIAVTKEAKEIFDSYKELGYSSGYIFPYVNSRASKGKIDTLLIEGFTGVLNKELKTIAKLASIDKQLSMHIARHSWAQRAYESGWETRKIQQGLGHSDINTTITYLADLTDTSLDDMNEEITG